MDETTRRIKNADRVRLTAWYPVRVDPVKQTIVVQGYKLSDKVGANNIEEELWQSSRITSHAYTNKQHARSAGERFEAVLLTTKGKIYELVGNMDVELAVTNLQSMKRSKLERLRYGFPEDWKTIIFGEQSDSNESSETVIEKVEEGSENSKENAAKTPTCKSETPSETAGAKLTDLHNEDKSVQDVALAGSHPKEKPIIIQTAKSTKASAIASASKTAAAVGASNVMVDPPISSATSAFCLDGEKPSGNSGKPGNKKVSDMLVEHEEPRDKSNAVVATTGKSGSLFYNASGPVQEKVEDLATPEKPVAGRSGRGRGRPRSSPRGKSPAVSDKHITKKIAVGIPEPSEELNVEPKKTEAALPSEAVALHEKPEQKRKGSLFGKMISQLEVVETRPSAALLSHPGVRLSRSGRVVMPVLEFWRNQTVIRDRLGVADIVETNMEPRKAWTTPPKKKHKRFSVKQSESPSNRQTKPTSIAKNPSSNRSSYKSAKRRLDLNDKDDEDDDDHHGNLDRVDDADDKSKTANDRVELKTPGAASSRRPVRRRLDDLTESEDELPRKIAKGQVVNANTKNPTVDEENAGIPLLNESSSSSTDENDKDFVLADLGGDDEPEESQESDDDDYDIVSPAGLRRTNRKSPVRKGMARRVDSANPLASIKYGSVRSKTETIKDAGDQPVARISGSDIQSRSPPVDDAQHISVQESDAIGKLDELVEPARSLVLLGEGGKSSPLSDIRLASRPVRCPQCLAQIATDAEIRFCPQCSFPLAKSTKANRDIVDLPESVQISIRQPEGIAMTAAEPNALEKLQVQVHDPAVMDTKDTESGTTFEVDEKDDSATASQSKSRAKKKRSGWIQPSRRKRRKSQV